MNRRVVAVIPVACLAAAVFAVVTGVSRISLRREQSKELAPSAELSPSQPAPPPITSELTITSGTNLDELLRGAGVDPKVVASVVEAARPVFDFRRLRNGNRLSVTLSSPGQFESLLYQMDSDHELLVSRAGEDYRAQVREVPSSLNLKAVAGELHSSLFETVAEMGEQPELAIRLAEIFAFDLDFYTDPQPGDTFRVVLEKREYNNGQVPTYGRIVMAEYVNAGRPYTAVLFRDERGQPAYYSADGKSLQKYFLRSPLKFAARISSRFTRRRLHPVLKIYRPHLGTDYAAATGTPVQAIAGGRVTFSGRQGGGGNVVQIKHANGYVSYYMHLSRRFVRTGEQVKQGERIGLVGATGLATGPHLDFRLRRNGSFVNFESMKMPPAHPVPQKDLAEFIAVREQWAPVLSGAAIANAGSPATPAQTVAGQ